MSRLDVNFLKSSDLDYRIKSQSKRVHFMIVYIASVELILEGIKNITNNLFR